MVTGTLRQSHSVSALIAATVMFSTIMGGTLGQVRVPLVADGH